MAADPPGIEVYIRYCATEQDKGLPVAFHTFLMGLCNTVVYSGRGNELSIILLPKEFLFLLLLFFVSETGSHCVARAGLELIM